MDKPPLKLLHPEANRIPLKLEMFRKLDTEALIASLCPGQEQPLTCRPDGLVLEGNHRLIILLERKYNIHDLPRVIREKDSLEDVGEQSDGSTRILD